MLFTSRWMHALLSGLAGCGQIGRSCQRISRYVTQSFACRTPTEPSWLSEFVRKMLSSGTRADQAPAEELKALPNSENAWHELSETLKIDANGTGVTTDKCSAGVICQNNNSYLLADMQIPTTPEAEAMAMARRMQHSLRLRAAEQRRNSLMAELMINRVRISRSHG